MDESRPASLHVEYCDQWSVINPDTPFLIGREGDLAVDDNPYLHRNLIEVRYDRFWSIANVGSTLSATISDRDGSLNAWLSPGARLPLVLALTDVRFTAGATSYQLTFHLGEALMSVTDPNQLRTGSTTLRPVILTENQLLLVLSLAEPSLRDPRARSTLLPNSNDAARRLGWALTKWNRQLDAVCQKLARAGVRGVHGDLGALASNRRARLVEYALATHLVTQSDLQALDQDRPAKSHDH